MCKDFYLYKCILHPAICLAFFGTMVFVGSLNSIRTPIKIRGWLIVTLRCSWVPLSHIPGGQCRETLTIGTRLSQFKNSIPIVFFKKWYAEYILLWYMVNHSSADINVLYGVVGCRYSSCKRQTNTTLLKSGVICTKVTLSSSGTLLVDSCSWLRLWHTYDINVMGLLPDT